MSFSGGRVPGFGEGPGLQRFTVDGSTSPLSESSGLPTGTPGSMSETDFLRPDPVAVAEAAGILTLERTVAIIDDPMLVAIYNTYYSDLYRTVWILAGPDAAQNIVEEAFVSMHNSSAQNTSPKGFAYKMLIERYRTAFIQGDTWNGRFSNSPATESAVGDGTTIERLERPPIVEALQSLSTRQQEAAVLIYFAGLSMAETAFAMNVSISTVKDHITKALSKMQSVYPEP
ncbi:MAG TPA: sigma-70 family RNA polymerase sigma factor [Candidatus Saccharimonadales bacterium]|nr:sigma-70 family RNA polymerase sigma factor [Candidatus Saccharimonadales bacterium]